MPKYYHVAADTDKPINFNDTFINDQNMYFSKKNSYWYAIMHQYEKRCKYELSIPSTHFTTSFNTKKPDSIFKVTIDNFDEYKKRFKKYGRGKNIFESNTNIIGIDATILESPKFLKEHWRKIHGRKNTLLVSELIIWKLPKSFDLQLINCLSKGGNLLDGCTKRIYDCNFPIDS